MLFFLMMAFFSGMISEFFFFKQKTAYDMRISDWSSDVCASDLARFRHQFFGTARLAYRDGGHAFGHAGHAESPAFTMSHSGRLIDRPGARVNSSRLRNAGTSEKGHAMDDDDLPRRQGGALAALTRDRKSMGEGKSVGVWVN